MFYFFLFILASLAFNKLIIKNNFFLDNVNFSKHKNFTTSALRIPFSAGFLLIIFFFFFNSDFKLFSLTLILIIFLSGFLSDIFKNFSPLIRLLIQILTSYLFITFNNISIIDTRLDLIDDLFKNYEYLSILFTIFCIIVLINGTNFIDGVNINVIGYYTIIFSIIYYICISHNIIIDFNFLIKLIIFLLFLLILNINNKTQLGDGGSYLLAFFTSIYLIQIVNNNSIITPYFIILLLWYPCFENLFSIIRKTYQKKKISAPDNYHLHQLIFLLLKRKKIQNPNNLSGSIITIYNLCIFLFSVQYLNNTKIILLIISMNILLYIYLYNKLIIRLMLNKGNFKK